MSVFKKLVGFLFEEEEEIEDEGELEEIAFREPSLKRSHTRMEEASELKHAPIYEKPRVETVVRKQSVQPAPVEAAQEKKFTTIEISEEQPKKTAVKSNRSAQSVRGIKRNEPLKQQEFTFTPVISPIFGMDETAEPKHAKKSQEDIPQIRKTISIAPRKNPLGTVLSPMYGATELEEFEEEAKLRLDSESDAFFEAETEEVLEEAIAYDSDSEEDEIVRVPLEELLSNDENAELSDDLLQFSLFGDDEVVSTEKNEASYTIKE